MDPINYYNDFFELQKQRGNTTWSEQVKAHLTQYFENPGHGDYPRWLEALKQLPSLASGYDGKRNVPRFGIDPDDEVPLHQEALNRALLALRPWRKGPLDIGGILVDSEWRCDWKWQRVAPHISPLKGRHVLDVGCGNGYYSWRMAGEGAASVTGVDPSLLFIMQWLACRHYAGDAPVWTLPLKLEDLPVDLKPYDTVFSMGVLYHRREPMDHLQRLYQLTKPGGELVLETLVSPQGEGLQLTDGERYARMRNVWFIDTPQRIQEQLKTAGFERTRMVDMATTTTAEQRSTAWMPFDSLAEALDPEDISHTIEGYPAPTRAIFIANKSS